MIKAREKLSTAMWFARRPAFWAQALELTVRKFTPAEPKEMQENARSWAETLSVAWKEALSRLDLLEDSLEPPCIPRSILQEARERARQSQVHMGGPGHVDLIFAVVALTGAERAIETGVAYGWSTMAILAALEAQQRGYLISVDMPYPKANNEPFVGIVVPPQLKTRWRLIREPDRFGLRKAIAQHASRIDFAHYDSDKSYRGRMYAYPKIWDALVEGGVFISDDIQDNFAFRDFCETRGIQFQVVPYQGKFVGIARKGSVSPPSTIAKPETSAQVQNRT